jgi:hypothetical protein
VAEEDAFADMTKAEAREKAAFISPSSSAHLQLFQPDFSQD